MNRTPVLYRSDSDDPEELPWKWRICRRCSGHGKSSAHLGVISQEAVGF